jgi:hypothetical protein
MALLTAAAYGGSLLVALETEPSVDERADLAKVGLVEMDALVDADAPSEGARVAEPMPASVVVDEVMARDASTSVVDDALIVRTGMLELEVGDVATVLALARREISGLGGYMAGSDEYDQGEQRWATVTYRVPVERFGEAIDSLRGLADRVVRETTQSQEVTAQVVDLDARIKNMRASESALVAIMDRAGRIDDVLSVQLRLEDVRRQVEQLTAQRDDLAGRAALATLTAYWTTPVAAVAVAQESWDFATQVDGALAQTIAALQGLASVLVWVAVVALPLLGVPLLLAIGAILVIRRRSGGQGEAGPSGSAAMS